MKIDINKLQNLRKQYLPTRELTKNFLDISKNNDAVNCVRLSDSELLKKLNSDKFKLHPVYPIIINHNGEDIYDIRDNFKIIVKKGNVQHSATRKRKACMVSGYGSRILSKLVAEAWYGKVVKDDESVHHKDHDRDNDDYRNLEILNKDEHKRLHGVIVANVEELKLLRTKYLPTKALSNEFLDISKNNNSIKNTNISDLELIEKINSKKFKLHPLYPVVINCNGTEIYDIRDNFKIVIKNNNTSRKKKACMVSGYGNKAIDKLVIESWSGKIMRENERIYYKDNNLDNSDYRNLKVFKKKINNKVFSTRKQKGAV